jgi:hypothetical protein
MVLGCNPGICCPKGEVLIQGKRRVAAHFSTQGDDVIILEGWDLVHTMTEGL